MAQLDSDEWFEMLGAEICPTRTFRKQFRIWMIAMSAFIVLGLYIPAIWPIPILSTIMYGLAAMCFVGGMLWGSSTLQVRERGVVWKRRFANLILIPYAEITRIYFPAGLVTNVEKPMFRAKILTDGRDGLYLGQFPEVDAQSIVTILQDAVIPDLATQFYAEMQAGASIEFGDVQATRIGLQYQESPIVAWCEIREYQFSASGFRIFVRNRPLATMQIRKNTMNLPILMFLIDIMPKMNIPAEFDASSAKPMQIDEVTGSPIGSREVPVLIVGYPETDPKLGTFLCGLPKSDAYKIPLIGGGLLMIMGLVVLLVLPKNQLHDILGGMSLVFGFIGLVIAPIIRNPGMAIYQHGVAKGGKRLQWDEMEQMTYAVGEVHQYGMATRTVALKLRGPRTTIQLMGSSLPVESICEEILNQAKAVMVPTAVQTIQNDGCFQVGSVKLMREGMQIRKRQVPFARISHFEIVAGKLAIFERDELKPIARVASTEANFPVLIGVLHSLKSNGTLASERPPILAKEER